MAARILLQPVPVGYTVAAAGKQCGAAAAGLEVGLESEDYEQERADAHDLAMIALDRKIDDDESSRYNAIVQRMLRRAYLAEMA